MATLLASCTAQNTLVPTGDLSDPKFQAGATFRDCPVCPQLVIVPAGRFVMGYDSFVEFEDRDAPIVEPKRFAQTPARRQVTISRPFAAGKFEITFDEWDACVDAGGCGKYSPKDNGWGRGNRPASNINWHDAKLYVDWLSKHTGRSYRLLSEAEWEYAARGGSTKPYPLGNGLAAACESGNIGSSICIGITGAGPSPVGNFPANGFGIHDTVGNVNEWVEDCWHSTYRGAPSDGTPWIDGGDCSRRVFRSGSWNNTRYRNVSSGARWGVEKNYRGANSNTGLRVALDLN